MTKVRHPIFARAYTWLSPQVEKLGVAEHRIEALAGLTGRVIEVGAGNGLNFAHYPPEVDEVVAVEPEQYLRAQAELAAKDAPVPVTVTDGVADELPCQGGSFEAGVASLVLCSVPDQLRALAELKRVIKPGGELRFYEHVRSADPRRARMQTAIDVVWPHFGGGCHTSRDTVAAIERAGFVMESLRSFEWAPSFMMNPVAPHVIGCARRPD